MLARVSLQRPDRKITPFPAGGRSLTRYFSSISLAIAVVALLGRSAMPQEGAIPIPRAQDKPPGPALSPEEAVKRFKVPEGFSVEVVASEPDVVNPVAMTIDEKGRFWVTESFEYPRREPGPGRDRVKTLEDTDGDGKVDKVTVFAEGLNIPSGIAVGHGGVWVANAPDILFMQDTDGDGKADKQEVVVTGFGRDDTHELPNSLTWGPDGWLYGLNGVFNASRIEYRGKKYEFTCALFRIHPKTRDFEVFCEGTSNPWGVAFDGEGSAFVSACVIDHLWHLAESAYYQRQGGPYPPFTWHMNSIVKHKHQKAAYCGITYFDSDAYPPEHREKLYMGNIHGNCINVDKIQRSGSTYTASTDDDFMSTEDVWFMPVVQKTGPDGCLYVLDWYDRYHCYQDANADPKGIDRGHGRLYRIRYKDSPHAKPFDMAKDSDEELLAKLGSPNVYVRDIAQRLLSERAKPEITAKLQAIVLDESAAKKARMHALFALSSGNWKPDFHEKLLNHSDSVLRSWAVRVAGNQRTIDPKLRDKIVSMASDAAPDVKLQVAIASRKLADVDALPVLVEVLANAGDDALLPHIVWQNLHPLLAQQDRQFLAEVKKYDLNKSTALKQLLPRATERILAAKKKQ
jgi:putative membrane-bound dehydrogenase-like protein